MSEFFKAADGYDAVISAENAVRHHRYPCERDEEKAKAEKEEMAILLETTDFELLKKHELKIIMDQAERKRKIDADTPRLKKLRSYRVDRETDHVPPFQRYDKVTIETIPKNDCGSWYTRTQITFFKKSTILYQTETKVGEAAELLRDYREHEKRAMHIQVDYNVLNFCDQEGCNKLFTHVYRVKPKTQDVPVHLSQNGTEEKTELDAALKDMLSNHSRDWYRCFCDDHKNRGSYSWLKNDNQENLELVESNPPRVYEAIFDAPLEPTEEQLAEAEKRAKDRAQANKERKEQRRKDEIEFYKEELLRVKGKLYELEKSGTVVFK